MSKPKTVAWEVSCEFRNWENVWKDVSDLYHDEGEAKVIARDYCDDDRYRNIRIRSLGYID